MESVLLHAWTVTELNIGLFINKFQTTSASMKVETNQAFIVYVATFRYNLILISNQNRLIRLVILLQQRNSFVDQCLKIRD